ncbi:dethiobiotin synthase [Anatilimnocola floriformis]|uniref:dethiobiotin synthase n=1 Tax=Anatilimnocola floriformis TaxID=2948575 RepID=UPI0020C3BCC1|nr:dethiobiotin synthase [Anatilimnocola floriformis]
MGRVTTGRRTVAARKSAAAPSLNPHAARVRGLFIAGTDTGVGKTYVAASIARELAQVGWRVGVYKPAASGCHRDGKRTLVSDDAVALWNAAGRPGKLSAVCPQRFEAPLAPHLAAKEERKEIDAAQLRRGLQYWLKRSDVVIVEGAGGLMSPVGEEDYVADLARDFGFPLVIVAANRIGTINHTLQTLIAAQAFGSGLPVAGIVLNDVLPPDGSDPSVRFNRCELELRCVPPVLAQLGHSQEHFDRTVDWLQLAQPARVIRK